MAWNPSPRVADCREIARKWGCGIEQVIIIAIDGDGRTITATYGRTLQLCNCADVLGQAAIKGIASKVEEIEAKMEPETLPILPSHTAALLKAVCGGNCLDAAAEGGK